MLHVVKRNGREVQFNSEKITNAIIGTTDKITVEEIQNIVERILLLNNECR